MKKEYKYYLVDRKGNIVTETNEYYMAISEAQCRKLEMRQRLPHIIYKGKRIDRYVVIVKAPVNINQLDLSL